MKAEMGASVTSVNRTTSAMNESSVRGKTVMIDNYDSFAWNVYQYLALAGAEVQVFRNDEITLEDLVSLGPSRLVVSPGPGHPLTDCGISIEAIKHFAGKVPVLGVCMGEQCIYAAFGGKVEYAGEILHGKTSTIQHDGKGVFHGIPQNIAVTRYHSLSGTHATLPEDLEVSSRTQNGIIMGVRHKTFTMEGVQFHPESILSEHGHLLIQNFLALQGGSWPDSSPSIPVSSASPSILDRIFNQRKRDVQSQCAMPGFRMENLELHLKLNVCPPLVDFVSRLAQRTPALMAEIKRASPSKGDIDIHANAASQAKLYASAGASVISVLTEPTWFKGSLSDLHVARMAVANLPNRPAILRKDFIFDRYQVLEARIAGADTVLLIVKMLPDAVLSDLYTYSQSLGMEPLVEVNDRDEMARALRLRAKVIGVNNRDLTSFHVDLETSSSLVSMVPQGTILCALSGISTSRDVAKYASEGIKAVLVGEALMKAHNTRTFIADLLGWSPTSPPRPKLIKVCGTRSVDSAQAAIEEGVHMIGMIFDPTSRRAVKPSVARQIVQAVRDCRAQKTASNLSGSSTDYFGYQLDQFLHRAPLTVGVFRNQSLEVVQRMQREFDLDVVQLHGNEPLEWARLLPSPVLRRFRPGEPGLSSTGYHALPLLDAGSGGSGQKLDWEAVRRTVDADTTLILAGGLDPSNVEHALAATGAAGVDVSSGVETNGEPDALKVRAFIRNAKSHDVS